jgi:YD repeat-containing protein
MGSFLAFFIPAHTVAPSAPLTQPTANVDFDFDNDGKTDISRWQSSSQEWRLKNSSGGSVTNINIGSSSSIIAPGDFDGDGKTDRAVFNAGTWTVKQSSNGSTVTFSWGTTGDKPVPADYDGNGKDDLAIYRPSTNTWWIYYLESSTYTSISHGSSGDIPVQGDYDGDGKADVAVFRPSNGNWYVIGSTAGSSTFTWGSSSDTPVPADYDGDGHTDYAVYRPSTGAWWIYKSSTGTSIAPNWGNYEDQPVPGDYDGDSKADLAIWRPANGVWYIVKSSTGGYQYETLGQAGDIAVSSAYVKQTGSQAFTYALAKARLSPKNATGGSNLYSQNFSWGTSLAGLPGRAGLDAGLGISYNSLVWTQNEGNIYFDTDYSNVSPGFRLGFPTIEPIYYDATTSKYNYMMVTPSGARTEFRQTAVTNTYETADSSYLQLKVTGASSPNDPVENLTIKVYGTDGTQMSYEWKAGAYRCSQIKDRNGNYITIDNDDQGVLRTVTDTLGRVITVNYDNDLYPTSITQTWKEDDGSGSNTTHTYASFSYTTKTVSTDFDGLTIVGPPNGTDVKVLDRITYANGFSTKFDYNGYLQVWKVRNYAADSSSHVLNYVSTNLDDSSLAADQTDCPRFTQTNNWVENFNVVSGTAREVITYNTAPSVDTYTVGGQEFEAAKIQLSVKYDPNELLTNIYVGASDWREGLSIASEDCLSDCSSPVRWTWTDWTQDDPDARYLLNPRMIETKIGDGTNTKRTTTDYYLTDPLEMTIGENHTSLYGLPRNITQYDADQSTVLKKIVNHYQLDSAYTDRRIIGLPSEVDLYDAEDTLTSKTTYAYDEGSFGDSTLAQNITPSRHDGTNYSSSFISGRGNLTSISRWDVLEDTAHTSHVKYNTAGSPVAQIDPLDRTVKIEYTDNFNSTVTTATYAYPTKITEMADTADSGNNFSEAEYRFDIGANVWARSPAPAGHSAGDGKQTSRNFDSLGRVIRNTIVNTGAYTRYDYFDSGIRSKSYSTIVDTANDDVDTSDEVLTESWTDGAGRILRTRTENPDSTGGFAAVLTEYDMFGQVTRQSVPTEVSVNTSTNVWTVAGDDATRGFIWNSQEYDWKGRATRSIPSDSTGSDGKDTLVSYDGCGCAGGQVTTVEGPIVPVPGSESSARRKQKSYADILGRTIQQETYEWDGSTVYATVVNTFNTRDQVTQSRQYAGSTSSSTYQDTTVTYDGFGRTLTTHRPEQIDSGDDPTNTTFAYNDDDSVASVTDGRGAVTNYDYDGRGLLHQKSYTVPSGSGIHVPADVTYAYDALGNRTSMADGLGGTTYAYDELSRLTSETREINDTDTEFDRTISFSYTYTPGGDLASFSNSYDSTANITYVHDKLGRVTDVNINGHAGGTGTVSSLASDISYRAFGAIKSMKYEGGDEKQMAAGYNNRLQLTSFDIDGVLGTANEYYPDGKLKKVSDTYNDEFDRLNKYDHQGRISVARSGLEARDEGETTNDRPYREDLSFDNFSHLTARTGKVWDQTASGFTGATYENNRSASFSYDADGHETLLPGGGLSTISKSYDAAGRGYKSEQSSPRLPYQVGVTLDFDGDGTQIKEEEKVPDPVYGSATYYFKSSVLGRVYQTNWRYHDHVEYDQLTVAYLGGSQLAFLAAGIAMNYENPVTGAQRGAMLDTEPDPLGIDTGLEPPPSTPPTSPPGGGGLVAPRFMDDMNLNAGCALAGLPSSCSNLLSASSQDFYSAPHEVAQERAPGENKPPYDRNFGWGSAYGTGNQKEGFALGVGAATGDCTPENPCTDENGQLYFIDFRGERATVDHEVLIINSIPAYRIFKFGLFRQSYGGEYLNVIPGLQKQPAVSRAKSQAAENGIRQCRAAANRIYQAGHKIANETWAPEKSLSILSEPEKTTLVGVGGAAYAAATSGGGIGRAGKGGLGALVVQTVIEGGYAAVGHTLDDFAASSESGEFLRDCIQGVESRYQMNLTSYPKAYFDMPMW